MGISHSTIRRCFEQGLDSIIRLVTQLEDRIEDFMAVIVSNPGQLIYAQAKEIQRLSQIIENKDAELMEAHDLNQLLQAHIRELEKNLEDGTLISEPIVRRDSHNSNQPPSLDLPWKKPQRTRSLRKSSELKVSGQPGHIGVTLQMVTVPNRIIMHEFDPCQQCGASVEGCNPSRIFRRQIFEIENGSLSVIEHRTSNYEIEA